MKKKLIAIVGPTAVGKTETAIALARLFHTEIISADSRQFYKELNIGVARPSEKQLQEVKHHFIACRSLKDEYAAGQFGQDALKCLQQLFSKHDVAVLVGGSGLYVNAVCEGLDAVPPKDEKVRVQLEKELNEKGLAYLQRELKKADPDYYQSADIRNPRRVLRALEVCRISGKPFSSFHKSRRHERDFQVIKIGLTMERNELYERINHRVDEMMKRGLLEEVRQLIPYKGIHALQTVGYRELFDYFDGNTDLKTAVNLIKQNTRHYAKRQFTWFRKDKEIKWFEPSQKNDFVRYIRSYMR
ncbi:MAG TPA: tRNA (adenosine(37)-N6)-dimethylallyltransferase MiaA [Chitinophagales bacterium]|nr:tRNA (adenosine(37)-N6)-dimethylallyltransferase MiaA [Chitinophagales bacterium]